ncbi:MAG: hypothetical protein OIF48_08600 [Silicimonas sp.]|nr:hypothetical protein [Silicimonas sp.]
MQKKFSLLLVAATLVLSACSQGTDMERAAVGGLAGCVVGDFIDEGSCITGGILGAAAGALADDVNL